MQASGGATGWTTGAAAAAALLAYVQAGMSFTSAQQFQTVSERGVPNHHKFMSKDPIEVTFQCLWTGAFPTAITAVGTTVPMYHIEHRASAGEIGAGAVTGSYRQLYGGVLISQQHTERAEGNTIDLTFRCLGIGEVTGSGYLS